jgi:hypothetical protein
LYGTVPPFDHQNANLEDVLNPHLEQLPFVPSQNVELNDTIPPNSSPVQYLLKVNVDWDINEFFDLDNAALESTTHRPTSAEPLYHNSPAPDVPAQPALNTFFTSSKRLRPASEFQSQTDAFAAQSRVTTNIKGQAAIQPQFYQSVEHSDSHISASVSIIYSHHACTFRADFKHQRIPFIPAPNPYSGIVTSTLATPTCYGPEAMHPGFHCFDWKGQEGKQQDQRPAKKPRKEISKQQREEAKEVREKGACLRCYVLKLKVLDICVIGILFGLMPPLVLQRISLQYLQSSVRTRSFIKDLTMEGMH